MVHCLKNKIKRNNYDIFVIKFKIDAIRHERVVILLTLYTMKFFNHPSNYEFLPFNSFNYIYEIKLIGHKIKNVKRYYFGF